MVSKVVIILSLAVAAYAVPLVPVSKVVYAEPEAPAHYEFSYSVHDDHSGDVKQQQEARQGDAVHGSYSLVQPDGVHRIVEYTADKEHGFNANVRYEGTPVQAAPAKIAYAAPVAKVAYAAPVAKVAYAPIAYAAPVAKVAYAAPIAKLYILQFLAFSALVAAATAVAVPVVPVAKLAYAQPEAPAQYEYTYSVHDNQSGDVKQQQESRSGDAVHGSYSLVQPDGVHRIVDYTADEEHGFNAVVRYEGTPIPQAPAKIAVAAPVAYAPAPVTKIVSAAPVAKVTYAAPVAKLAYAAPVAKLAYAAPVAKLAYAAPVAKVAYSAAPAQVTYAQAPAQVTYAHAPAQVTYAHAPAQVTYSQAPAQVTYSQAPAQLSYQHAPVYAAAPVAKVAYAAAPVAKVAYAENLGHVTFSSPAVSYHH
ncbi:cuticle protein-like [Spodoptera frugiperda]|uniref:Cuticle protein-like n=1 Tax=Spodoptera frugiperda TaxID=7108 RepID=A0A9R0EDN6_SPOFR|nr:cuticle protein-like [Spodoptera frugiperda]